MKILLVTPPAVNDIGKVLFISPPLGLLYLAAFLEKNGYSDTKIIDADAARISWQGMGDLFVKEKPDIVGITGVSRILPALFKTAEIAREKLPKCVIVAGGPGAAHEPERVLKSAKGSINFVVRGEGEFTLLELVKGIESGSNNFGNIAGLAFLDEGGNLIVTKPRDYIMDLDSLPWPAYHLLFPDFSQYHGMKADHKETPRPVATMFASRGCPHRCAFCSLQSKLWRGRDPKDVVAEMEFYKNKFGVKSIQLYDDEFLGLTPKQNEWVGDICDEIIKRKLNLPWLVQGRCSPYVDLATLKKMRTAGCRWIWWGVESGSQRILDEVIHKGVKIENVFRNFSLAKEAGIKSLAFIIVGFPGETAADIKLTGDLLKNLKPDLVKTHILTPWPGTEIRRYLEENNLLVPDFDYYKLDARHLPYRTKEMTSEEIIKHYKYLSFRFERGSYFGLIKLGLKSLLTIGGWKKLFRRIKIIINFFIYDSRRILSP